MIGHLRCARRIPRICSASDQVKTVSLGYSATLLHDDLSFGRTILGRRRFSAAPIYDLGDGFRWALQLPAIGARMFSSCCQHPLWSVGVQSML